MAPDPRPEALQIVGTSPHRLDAREKVMGRTRYTTDLTLSAMVHAKVWRSPLPHARVDTIDTAAALAAPGVLAVLTAADLTNCDPYYGTAYKDQPILAGERIRYAGEPVAVVIAETERQASAALHLLDVSLSEYPAALDTDAALADDAPILHEHLRPSGHFRDLSHVRHVANTNICHHQTFSRGDLQAGFAEADEIFEDAFSVPPIYHYAMEPHAVLAKYEQDSVTVWTATQHPFPVRKELAEIFNLPLAAVQVIVPPVGGAYGSKCYTKIEPLAVACARHVQRAARLALTVSEACHTVTRHGMTCRVKTGVRRDGTITARQFDIVLNTGAYADVGPRVATRASFVAPGPYRIPHVQANCRVVYTNTVPAGAFRGYGIPQVTWAGESQINRIAEYLGIDAVALRQRNLLHAGEEFSVGDLPMDADLPEGLRRTAETIGWQASSEPRRGKGLACAFKDGGIPHSVSTAVVRVHADGSTTVFTGSIEHGQGSDTILAQIASETLGIPLQQISLTSPDTALTPYDQGTSASRTTTLVGRAVHEACLDARHQLLDMSAGLLHVSPSDIRIQDGVFIAGEEHLTFAETISQHFGLPGGEVIGKGEWQPSRASGSIGGSAVFWEIGMGGAEVEVDAETGAVNVLQYVSTADVGQAIHQQQCEAQDEGGAMQGLGSTLFEALVSEDGQLLNPNLIDYRIPAFSDLPASFNTVLLQHANGPGPYGAKGVGESGMFCVAPAIGNAIARVTGVRLHDLPLTPERVWRLAPSPQTRAGRHKGISIVESQSSAHDTPVNGVVGASLARTDGREKVTGRAVFITGLNIPGMVHAKLWRSPLPHARIRGIDTAAAAASPGVLAILTADDFVAYDRYFGPAFKDQSMLAIDRVRYAGEPVVAVVATSEREAAAALQLLDVDLDPLPAVTNLDEALAPDAPLLHENLRTSGHFRDLSNLRPVPGTNICHHFQYARGDIEQGFAEADHIFEHTFTFPMVHHYSMEPHVSIASAEDDRITVWAATQHPFPARKELAEIFNLPLSRVEVIVPYLGGAYGNKSYTKLEPLTVAMSRTVGRPVRLAFSVEESFKIGRRAAARVTIKTGIKTDGTLVARHCIAHYQIGAYADVGPRIVQKAGYTAGGPYRIPHLRIDTHAVYSNTVNSVAFRGYGVPQLAWAYESQMDIMAEHLGRDALDLRLQNLLHRGEVFAPGDLPIDCDFLGSLKTAAAAIGWHAPVPQGHGRGLACVIKAPLAPSVSSAIVRMHADGSVTILAGTIEFGQGARTVLCQIVAEELALPLAWVRLALPEFGMSPYDQATSSSRSTTLMGLALQTAARDIRDQLVTIAAAQQQLSPERLRLRQGAVEGPEIRVPYTDLLQHHFGMPGGELIGRGIYRGERGAPLGGVAPFWEVSLAAAEVSVDETTGQVHLERYVSIADVGKAINPLQCESQEEGGVMMGIGHTFFENLVYEDGQLLNPGLIDYRIPAMSDLPPEMRSILVENGDGPGPFGSKGIGESGLMPTSPAIANALARAAGVRMTELPLTPERVRRALQSRHQA